MTLNAASVSSHAVGGLATLALCAGAFGITAQPGAGTGSNNAGVDPAILEHEARPIYMQHCASCHGEYLQGGSAGGFLDGVWSAGSDRWNVFRSIKFGLAESGMPAYGPALSDREIGLLTDYVHALPERIGIPVPEIPALIETSLYELNAEVVIDEGLETPWAIEFIDAGTALITEKPGRLRWFRDGRLDPEPIEGVPDVLDRGQGGMLDVALDPAWNDGERWVYLSFSDPGRAGAGMTKVVRGKVDGNRWTDEEVLFEADTGDYVRSAVHYGSRITFDREGRLYFSIGDRGQRPMAQDLAKPNGKVHRINRDGSIPSDNPFADRDDAYASVFSYGHRNPQGLAIDPVTGAVWSTEHGPMGGDEVNLVREAVNYGWPVISYGVNYNGTIITEKTRAEGMSQPALYWTPSIAPCGLAVYRGPMDAWSGNLLAGGLAHQDVHRLVVEGDRVIHDEVIFKGYGRVRDVTVAPDGAVHVVLNKPDRVVKLTEKRRVYRQ